MNNVSVFLIAIHVRERRGQLVAYGFTHSGVVGLDLFTIFNDELMQVHTLALDRNSSRVDQLDEVLGVGLVLLVFQ